jgi:predicted transcriptional regulator
MPARKIFYLKGGIITAEICTDCPLLPRVAALEQDSAHNKEAHKEIYQKLDASHTSVAVIEERLNQIKEDTEEIKTALQAERKTVQELRDRPGKRWEGIVDKAIWAVCAAVIAFLLGRVGL